MKLINRLLAGPGNGLSVPAYFGESLGKWERAGMGEAFYELRSYWFGEEEYGVWVDVSVPDDVSRACLFWFTRAVIDESLERQREMLQESMAASEKYANVIMLVGYAALFTLWVQMKDGFSLGTTLTTALLLAISVTLFVALELAGMIVRTVSLRGVARAVEGDPEEFGAAMEAHRARLSKMMKRGMVIQVPVMYASVLTGVAAFFVMLSAIAHSLWLQTFC